MAQSVTYPPPSHTHTHALHLSTHCHKRNSQHYTHHPTLHIHTTYINDPCMTRCLSSLFLSALSRKERTKGLVAIERRSTHTSEPVTKEEKRLSLSPRFLGKIVNSFLKSFFVSVFFLSFFFFFCFLFNVRARVVAWEHLSRARCKT